MYCREPGNGKCADCLAPNPTWASYNLGNNIFRPATYHRNISMHALCSNPSKNRDSHHKNEIPDP